MYKANVKFGAVPVQIEADTIKDLIKEVSFFAEMPPQCECGGVNLMPRHRKVEENDFYEIICGACHKTLPLGQHKRGDSLFVNKTKGWQEPYRKQNEE